MAVENINPEVLIWQIEDMLSDGAREKILKHGVHFAEGDNFLELMDNVLAVLKAGRWIPCSERLPERPDGYPDVSIQRCYFLVCLKSGCVESLGFDFDKMEWNVTGSPVVAWMQLPVAYTEPMPIEQVRIVQVLKDQIRLCRSKDSDKWWVSITPDDATMLLKMLEQRRS